MYYKVSQYHNFHPPSLHHPLPHSYEVIIYSVLYNLLHNILTSILPISITLSISTRYHCIIYYVIPLFLRVDVTEAQFAAMAIYITSGIFGPQIWSSTVSNY